MENEIKATDEMMKFFEKLLSLKEYVRKKTEESENKILQEIYNQLEEIIKEKK